MARYGLLLIALVFQVCALASVPALSHAAPPPSLLPLTHVDSDHPAGLLLDYFSDSSRRCDIACARQRFAQGPLEHSHVAAPNLGVTGSYWFRVDVQNRTAEQRWIAEANVPFLDDVQLYVLRSDGSVSVERSGDGMPTAQRPVFDRNIALPLRLAPGERATLLLRVTNEGPVTLPLEIKSRAHFDAETGQENIAYGIYFGMLACVSLYNLMLFLIMRDRSHLLYVLYAASFAATMATTYGFSALYFWPDSAWWINRSVPVSVLVTGFLVLLFARAFLALPRGSRSDRVMLYVLAWMIALLPVALFAPFGIAVQIIYVTVVFCVLWLLGTGIHQVAGGNRSARYFMLAWVVLMVAVAAFLLTKLGVLPSVPLTEYGILIGSALEAILLSVALAHRFALIREDSVRIQTEANAELERRVEERTRELDSALRARSEFLATVSHEIRTPMNGVLGITELLADTELTPRQREYAQIIQNSGRTLLTIINDVLDYSKIEAGKMTLEKVPFRIHDVINGATQIFQAEAARKKLLFHTRIAENVPEEIIGDPVRLQQVLNNLVSNALKFTELGEITLGVHREADGKLTFTVSDTGIGIDSDVQPRLFEAFNQGDHSTTRRFGGTGLGLAISRRLVELMGGSIAFRSNRGQGATFYFTIPVRTGATGSYRRIQADSAAAGVSLRLLVVDDNAINLQVASGLLRKLGHRVETVDSGEAALARLAGDADAFDVVLMDCEMPGMDGFVATREIRRREQDEKRERMPVIALSAHVFADKIAACHAAGMDDHLAKPLNIKVLEQTLARVAAARF
jgi:signal transduction histidine kinase/CheY-like chemotaxis protein